MYSSQLTTEILRRVYAEGFFPMVEDETTGKVEFYRPYFRCLFPSSGIHLSESMKRELRRNRYEIQFDTEFEAVIRGCVRLPGQNWIDEGIIRVYCEAFEEGDAHCVGTWFEGKLVGGVYGVHYGSAFFAESMFYRETNASKVALHALVEHCFNLGFALFDAQIMNPHLASLGAYELEDEQFMPLLKQALSQNVSWHKPELEQ